MNLYTQEDFEKMEQLKKELEAAGESDRFTAKMIQRRLRVGTERATQLFNDLTKQEDD